MIIEKLKSRSRLTQLNEKKVQIKLKYYEKLNHISTVYSRKKENGNNDLIYIKRDTVRSSVLKIE